MRNQPRTNTLHRMRKPATALALTAAALLAMSAPAAAAPTAAAPPPECPFTEALCLYEGENFTGARFTVGSLVEPGTCVSLVDHGWGDGRANSAINTHTANAALFALDDCMGGPYLVPGEGSIPDLGLEPQSVWVAA
ncbi:peptidase inhibitor family I36 protein [Glycomyces sp. NPDC021274]|uniref:peptidase inhibitor family I36 protein n=1 Tax=Glycomyces sp. NPDC021274 TaxID=3155120 RepID=UPI0033F23DB6